MGELCFVELCRLLKQPDLEMFSSYPMRMSQNQRSFPEGSSG